MPMALAFIAGVVIFWIIRKSFGLVVAIITWPPIAYPLATISTLAFMVALADNYWAERTGKGFLPIPHEHSELYDPSILDEINDPNHKPSYKSTFTDADYTRVYLASNKGLSLFSKDDVEAMAAAGESTLTINKKHEYSVRYYFDPVARVVKGEIKVSLYNTGDTPLYVRSAKAVCGMLGEYTTEDQVVFDSIPSATADSYGEKTVYLRFIDLSMPEIDAKQDTIVTECNVLVELPD